MSPTSAPPPASFAVGVRRPLGSAPPAVLAVVAELLGEPVTQIDDARGGMAPGCAAAVRGRSGRAIFVKAVGTATNARNVEFYRAEAAWGARLPEVPGIVRPLATRDLRLVTDAGEPDDWVITAFPMIDGAPPVHPWHSDDLARVLDAWLPIAEALTPCPYPEPSSDGLVAFFTGWAQIAVDPDDPWHAHAERWLPRELAFADAIRAGSSCTHSDLRADNLVIDSAGAVHVIDWVHLMRGPRWVDPAILMADVVASGADRGDGGSIDVATAWAHPVFDGAHPEQLVDALGCYAGVMHHLSRRPPSPGLPTIRAWQAVQADAVWRYVRRLPRG